MKIAVAGGTGVLGKRIVQEAEQRGHGTLVLSRAAGVDLTTGEGLDLTGVDVVVDATSVVTQSKRKAEQFFRDVSTNLAKAEQAAGVGHHLAISIVGIDDVPMGYYHGKREQERVVQAGSVPWTIVRVTQFHEFALQALHFTRVGPFSIVPLMLSQPVAATDVARVVVDLAEKGPSGRAPELAGPEKHLMPDLAKRVNDARGLGRRVLTLRVPGRLGKAIRSGALVPTTDGPRGTTTFEEWLTRP